MKIYLPLLVFFLFPVLLLSQELKYYDVSNMKLEGQPSGEVTNSFQRFPDSMRTRLRERVWELSENPAGLLLRFTTNASTIKVSYEPEGEQGFPHMPPTGVSGVDLYEKREQGAWQWAKGNFRFGDTITYNFKLSSERQQEAEHEYVLYLPLYVTVKWMKLGLPEDAAFSPLPPREKSPIVVYGTSITQGACAGRSGSAWTSRLSRTFGNPVLNFGFSGNGLLEPAIIAYISRLESKVIILDCLANFASGKGLTATAAEKRLVQSVRDIRKFKPMTPIILTDHAGYPHGELLSSTKETYLELNRANRRAYEQLQNEGIENLYLLSKRELNLKMDDFVDGVHPNDAGMEKYAKGYIKKLKEVFNR